ncbi:S49 family peptidase [Bartonella sp. DGB2]|uniref:S49 family peptidase n=1 Tax=Bartonella sp. DGB2 TaxID=3388426 RepID=UPI0039902334
MHAIYHVRGQKSLIAYASGDAASGAYWIASACDEIVVSKTSALGSIGVVGIYPSQNNADRKDPLIEIISSCSPNKRLDPSNEEGFLKLQQRIDAVAEVFVGTVARNRSVTREMVLEHYGGADVFIGADALRAGLADRLGALDGLVQDLNTKVRGAFFETEKVSHALSQPASQCIKAQQIREEKQIMDFESLKKQHPEWVEILREEGAQIAHNRFGQILNSDTAIGRLPLAL